MRRIIIALAMFGIIGTADANPRPIPRPIPHHNQTIIHDHDKTDVMPYVFVGLIAGVIIYEITQTRCDTGIICTHF